MSILNIPGRPIHIRITGESLWVAFEHIPKRMEITEVSSALHAFSRNDWSYFQNHWWREHAFLREASPTLESLAHHLRGQDLYSVDGLMALGRFLGLYDIDRSEEYMQDLTRLGLIPHLLQWGLSSATSSDQEERFWPAQDWANAISALSSLFHEPAVGPDSRLTLHVTGDRGWV